MYSDNLYDKVLLKPLGDDPELDHLLIVTGYATAAMGFHHLNESRLRSGEINIHLIVGMTSKDGLTTSNHSGFKKLVTDEFPKNFQCSYIKNRPPVHSKIYVWCKGNKPKLAFTGSANYTQTALCLNTQREVMTLCDASFCYDYFHSLIPETIYCHHPEAEEFITVYRDNLVRREYQTGEADTAEFDTNDYLGLPFIKVSLLGRNGKLHKRSGLNWGQRPELNREPNQAYIRLPLEICRTDFFPPKKVHFTLFTDDGKTLICTRAQDNGKAIETPHNNSFIGEYFRNRLGVSNGEPVLLEHLEKYGRTDVTFYKIDAETYYMDFSP